MTGKETKRLEIYSTALEMEMKGRDFYGKASGTCASELGRDMFRMLMEEEIKHVTRIREIQKSLSAGQEWPEQWEAVKVADQDLGRLFKEMAKKHGKKAKADAGDVEALEVGIDLETRAVDFYKEQQGKASHPLEKEFIEAMLVEERIHYRMLTDMKFYLTDPDGWFLEQERGGLDGA